VSRIYDAMRRGAALEAARTSPRAQGANGAAVVDPVAEGYQRVLQRIQARPEAGPPGVILVVSAVHGEGSSTVARELALLFARDGLARSVLVDANLRTPSQHLAFGVERSGGVTEIATHGLALDQALRNGASSSVPLLTCGRPTSNPAGALATPAMREALQSLRARFDWVILDGPPVTAYSDAGVLAPLTDGVVLVVQAERTRWEVAQQAKRALEEAGGRILGGVLSRRRFHIPEALYGLL